MVNERGPIGCTVNCREKARPRPLQTVVLWSTQKRKTPTPPIETSAFELFFLAAETSSSRSSSPKKPPVTVHPIWLPSETTPSLDGFSVSGVGVHTNMQRSTEGRRNDQDGNLGPHSGQVAFPELSSRQVEISQIHSDLSLNASNRGRMATRRQGVSFTRDRRNFSYFSLR